MQEEGSDTWEVVGRLPASQTNYAVTGLAPGGTYYAFCVAPTNSTADFGGRLRRPQAPNYRRLSLTVCRPAQIR